MPPRTPTAPPRAPTKPGDQLEDELEARQSQSANSLGAGVHQQVIKAVDGMVQQYLGNVRRAVQRMANLVESAARRLANSQPASPNNGQPRGSAAPVNEIDPQIAVNNQFVDGFAVMRQSVLDRIQILSKRMHDFTMQWTRAVGKQQSPLFDRIPPRGVELWRDFWDTARKQVRRINQEFWQLSQDMGRLFSGRLPAGSNRPPGGPIVMLPNALALTMYSNQLELQQRPADGQVEQNQQVATKRDPQQLFYEQMTAALEREQLKVDKLTAWAQANKNPNGEPQIMLRQQQTSNLIDEQDDDVTKNELNRNVTLRLQIEQEIGVFSSIFDIMRAFIQRLRESASNTVRDVMRPAATNNNNNDPVTPGPSVKPQVDRLLGETIESQRIINSQAGPILLPNRRQPNVSSRV